MTQIMPDDVFHTKSWLQQ